MRLQRLAGIRLGSKDPSWDNAPRSQVSVNPIHSLVGVRFNDSPVAERGP